MSAGPLPGVFRQASVAHAGQARAGGADARSSARNRGRVAVAGALLRLWHSQSCPGPTALNIAAAARFGTKPLPVIQPSSDGKQLMVLILFPSLLL